MNRNVSVKMMYGQTIFDVEKQVLCLLNVMLASSRNGCVQNGKTRLSYYSA